ncbi:MAG: hypothetical protein AAF402_11030 [Pseudomonadota bacterium]
MLIVAVAAIPPAATAASGVRINYSIQSGASTIGQTALVSDTHLFVRQIGGETNRDMIYSSTEQAVYLVNHATASYLRVDNEIVDRVANLVDSLSAGDEQSGLASVLRSMGLTNEPEPPIESRERGDSLRTAGYACRVFQFFQNAKLQSEACVAHISSLQLGKSAVTLRSLYRFGENIRSRAGRLLAFLGGRIPPTTFSDDVLPLMVYSAADQTKAIVDSIGRADFDSSVFKVPARYQQESIPFISG